MADTVSNHDLAVVTKGTDHLAITQGPTDVCFDPTKTVPAPYVHFVPSTQLGAGQTTKTMIVGQPIDIVIQRMEPGRCKNAGLAQPATQHLAVAPRLVDQVLPADQH